MIAPRLTAAATLALGLTACQTTQNGPRVLQDSEASPHSDWVQRAIAGDPYIRQLEARQVLDAFVGIRSMEDDAAWAPLDDQFDAGLSWQSPLLGERRSRNALLDSALMWDFTARFAYDQADILGLGGSDEIETRTWELSGGLILAPWRDEILLSPYVGGGMSLVFTDIERDGLDSPFEERDNTLGTYVRAGARFDLGQRRHVGVDVRWLTGTDDAIDGIGAGGDSVTVSFVMGMRF